MTEPKTEGLHKNVAKGAAIREMCKTKGFEILREEIDSEIKRVSKRMIDAKTEEDEALKLRRQVQVWVSLENILSKIMLTGEFSARSLGNIDETFDDSAGFKAE